MSGHDRPVEDFMRRIADHVAGRVSSGQILHYRVIPAHRFAIIVVWEKRASVRYRKQHAP